VADAHVVTSKIRASAASVTAAITAPTPGNALLVAVVSDNANSASHTCSDNQGNTYTKVANIDNGMGTSQWYAKNVASSGTHNVSVGGASAAIVGLVSEFSGVDTSAPLDGTGATNSGAGVTATTASKTNTNADDVIFAGMGDGGTTETTGAPSGGWTRAGQETDGATYMKSESAYLLAEASAAQSTSWATGGGLSWGATIACYIAAIVVAAPDVPAPQYSGGRYPSVAAIRTANVL
jgi:hypothetical protein